MPMHLTVDPGLVAGLTIASAVATVVVNLAFAIGVLAEANRCASRGERVVLAPGTLWALATLLGGVFVAVAFWFVHHSPRRGRDQRDLSE